MDAYSKWPSVVRMSKYPTTETTTMALDILFTTWGPPKTLVSDNGPQFGSKQFEDWCHLNGIVHLTSAPFHPPSNGEAERLVGIFKTAMRRSVGEEGKEKDKATMDFLREYRGTPNCATRRTPAELMIRGKFEIRSHLCNHPCITTRSRRCTQPSSRSATTSSFGATV